MINDLLKDIILHARNISVVCSEVIEFPLTDATESELPDEVPSNLISLRSFVALLSLLGYLAPVSTKRIK